MKVQDRLSAIEFAIDNEVREREFYLKNARAATNLVIRATFEALADEELEHIERLKELHLALARGGSWPEDVSLTIRSSRLRAVLADSAKRHKEIFGDVTAILEAIQKSIESEAKSAKFYLRLRDSVESPLEREFFGRLAEVEMDHCRALKNTEQFLNDPEVWRRLKDDHMG